MLRRIVKIVAVLAVAVPLAVVTAIPFIDDEAFHGALVAIPVVGDHADALLDRKQRIEAALGRYVDDAARAWTSRAGDGRGGTATPRVVVALPPAPARPAADQGRRLETEPNGDAAAAARPPPPPAIAPPPAVSRRIAPPPPLDIAPPPKPLVGIVEPAPEPKPEAKPAAKPGHTAREAAEAAAQAAAKAARPRTTPKPPAAETTTEPAKEPATRLTLPAAKTAKAPVPAPPAPRKPAAPDPIADQDLARGMQFYKGIGVDKDFKKAAQWFRRAAEKGHAVAQFNLGIMSYLGQGIDRDYARAAEWFRLAAEKGHAAAQYNLGFLYYQGKGVDKDDLQAYMWIDRAANLGDAKAIRARDALEKALPKDIFQR